MDSSTLLGIIVVVVVLIIFITYLQASQQMTQTNEAFSSLGYEPAPYGSNQSYGLSNDVPNFFNNTCSRSCCSQQWPTPFEQDYNPEVCANKNNYIPNPYTCTGSEGSGCLCLERDQAKYLYNRGGNA